MKLYRTWTGYWREELGERFVVALSTGGHSSYYKGKELVKKKLREFYNCIGWRYSVGCVAGGPIFAKKVCDEPRA